MRDAQMNDELVTFEEQCCPRIPGEMLQEMVDSYRTGNEGGFHDFVHVVVTDSDDGPHTLNGQCRL